MCLDAKGKVEKRAHVKFMGRSVIFGGKNN